MEDKTLILKQYESHRPPGDFHTHSYSHLAYVHQGCQIVSTDKHSLLSMPGSLVYIPAYTPHRAEFLKRSQVSLLKLPSNSTPNIKAVCMLDVSPIITQLFSVWKNETQDPKLADQYIDVLIDQCSRCAPTTHPFVAQGSMDRRLLIIIEALSDKPTIKMSISQLSQKTGASVRTLNRLFLSHFKASFKEIRNKVVMERAEQMMKKGISATVVAFELEYSSLSSFSTAYNKHQKKNMD